MSAQDFETVREALGRIFPRTLRKDADAALNRIQARVEELEAEVSLQIASMSRWVNRAEKAEAEAERLREALREIKTVVHEVREAPDGEPVIIVLRPETALDKAVAIARAALSEEEKR